MLLCGFSHPSQLALREPEAMSDSKRTSGGMLDHHLSPPHLEPHIPLKVLSPPWDWAMATLIHHGETPSHEEPHMVGSRVLIRLIWGVSEIRGTFWVLTFYFLVSFRAQGPVFL